MPTLFVDNLTVIDFSYVDSHRGIVGESWIVDLTLTGTLDEQGMVFDFGDIKKQIKRAIDEHYDHKLWFPAELPSLQQQQLENGYEYRWQDSNGGEFIHRSPNDAVIELALTDITPEAAAPLIADTLKKLLPSNVADIQLQLRQETINGASYQYSHGLQMHQGNCQRIAHGHRSAIEIYRDGQRDQALEQQWAEHWQDIYIGSREHLVAEQEEQLSFQYQAQQGDFELRLPAKHCYLIDTESTVELIAEHIAQQLQQQQPGERFTVKAFEGVGKGAIAHSGE